MTSIVFKQKKVKLLDQWNTRDFIMYYSNKLGELTGNSLVIPPEAWAGFGSRIKGFKKKLNLSNIEYKNFIDKVFSKFFINKEYEPSFGCIVSEKVYYLTYKIRESDQFSNEDFEALKKNLYADSSLFNKIQLDLLDGG